MINQNIQLINQINTNNNMINMILNNLLLSRNQNVKENEYLNQKRGNTHYLFKDSRGNKINIVFNIPQGYEMFVVPENIKIKDLFMGFLKEFKLDQKELGKSYNFIYQARKINVLDERNIIEYGLKNDCYIIFIDRRNNLIGG